MWQALKRLRVVAVEVFGSGRLDAARLRQYREALNESERMAFDQAVAETCTLLPYLRMLAQMKTR